MFGHLRSLAWNLIHLKKIDQELCEEIRAYLDLLVNEKIEAGLSPSQARRAALVELGGVEQIKEQVREIRAGAFAASCFRDIRYSIRTLAGTPGFTTVAVFSLALGIGSAAAMFSIVNSALLRPLPYRDPDRLVRVTDSYPKGAIAFLEQASRTMDLAGFTTDSEFNLTESSGTLHLAGSAVSANLFSLLGAHAELGRTFGHGDDAAANERTVVLSDALWRRIFRADRGIIGKRIVIDGRERVVAAVMPPEFNFPSAAAQLWMPIALEPGNWVDAWGAGFMPMIGRLRPGATITAARGELRLLIQRVIPLFPYAMARNWNADVDVVPLPKAMAADIGVELSVLVCAVGMILTIAFVNLASLLVSRAAARRKEMAVRASLGASRGRIIRQLLTESMVLACAGAGIGVLLASVILSALRAALPSEATPLAAGIDTTVLMLITATAVLAGAGCGLIPALIITRGDLAEAVKAGGPRSTRGDATGLRRWLIAGEVGFTVVLVVCAGLLMKSLWRLAQITPGFHSEQMLAAQVYLDPSTCQVRSRCAAFYDVLLQGIRTITGVSEAGAVNALPFSRDLPSIPAELEGHPLKPLEQVAPLLWAEAVTPDYFRMMRIPLLRGRGFTRADDLTSPGVVVVSEALARRFWPGEDPVGKRLRPVWDDAWRTVIGVAGDVEPYTAPDDSAEQNGAIYMPYPQSVGLDRRMPSAMTIMLRATAEPSRVGGEIRELVRQAGTGAALGPVRTIEAVVSASSSQSRSMLWIFAGFGVCALALVAIGVYGLLSYSLAQRKHEMAIRMAMGAARTDIVSLMLGEGMKYVCAGLASGLLASLAVTRMMTKFLYGVTATDPVTYLAVALAVMAVAAGAGYVPSRRAAVQDLMPALVNE